MGKKIVLNESFDAGVPPAPGPSANVYVIRELLDADDHYLVADGVNRELAINRALNLAAQASQLGYGGCGVQLRAREYGVGLNPIRVPSGTILIGTNTGVAAEAALGRINSGTVIAALPTLPFGKNIVETYNVALPPPAGKVNSDEYAHHVLIRDLRIHGGRQRVLRTDIGEAANTVPGAGLVVLHSGENCLVDRLFVTDCQGHGVHYYDTATPVQIGRVEVFTNGRSGRGSGVCLTGSTKTANQMLYIGGDNNYDALLEIDGGYGAVFHLHDGKSERWYSPSVHLHSLQAGHRKVIWLRNGNGGTFVLDALRISMGKPGTYDPGTGPVTYDVTSGEAIVQNDGATAAALFKVVVNGAIAWDANDGLRDAPAPDIPLYVDDYKCMINGVRQANSLVAQTIRGVPWKTVSTRIADGVVRPAAPDGTLVNATTRIEQIIARMVANGDWGP